MLIQKKRRNRLTLATAILGMGTIGATTLSANVNNPIISNLAQAVTKTHPIIVHAAEVTSIPSHTYGVDVSSYQNTDLTPYAKQGAKYAIIKLTEGTSYVNNKAQGQISSAHQNNMMVQAYHYATFGNNIQQAHQEAQYVIQHAQQLGLSKGSYIACDYEGTDNNPLNNANANTQAVLAFMQDIANAGYQPLAYSSASFFNQYLNKAQIIAKFPNSLWVAAYPYGSNATNHADFNYFPSTDGVVQWQFTDNKNGMHVDGDITVLPMANKGATVNNQQQQQAVINSGSAQQPIKYGTAPSSNIKGDGTKIGQQTNAKNVVNHTPTTQQNNTKTAQKGSQSQLKGSPVQAKNNNTINPNKVTNSGSNNLAQTNSKAVQNNSAILLLMGTTMMAGAGLTIQSKEN